MQWPSLRQRFEEPILDFDLLQLFLVTETGKQVVPSRKGNSGFERIDGLLYAGEISFSLTEVPPSAERITLQVPVTLAGKQALPVAVRVR
jgi:hypothetical protein